VRTALHREGVGRSYGMKAIATPTPKNPLCKLRVECRARAGCVEGAARQTMWMRRRPEE